MSTVQRVNCISSEALMSQIFLFIFCVLGLGVLGQLTGCSSGSSMMAGVPTVTAMSPPQIYTTGGTVAFAGTNFTADTTVSFGSVAATKVYFQNSTLITAVSPAVSAPATVDVVVTNASGTVTLSKALSYVLAPVTSAACTALPCLYKAYATGNTLIGGAQVASCTGCPDGQKVGSLGNGSDVIINDVYAPADGNYTLTISGCEGGGTEEYQVIVDDGTPYVVPLTGSNWNAPAAPVSITIPLKAGSNNTVELGNATAYSPDVVSITISSL
jgi:hypothetical protein